MYSTRDKNMPNILSESRAACSLQSVQMALTDRVQQHINRHGIEVQCDKAPDGGRNEVADVIR